MIGQKFAKPLTDVEGYSAAAEWANENGAMIVDKEDYYEVVSVPAPSVEKILADAIAKRDSLLAQTDWYAIRASEPGGKPIPDNVLAYRAELREIDKQPGWPSDVSWPVLTDSPAS